MFQELSVAFGVEYAVLVNGLPKDLIITVEYKKNNTPV
jgi:hypothetical protein